MQYIQYIYFLITFICKLENSVNLENVYTVKKEAAALNFLKVQSTWMIKLFQLKLYIS